MTAFPETFKCGGLLNGGAGFLSWQRQLAARTDPSVATTWKLSDAIDKLVTAGKLPDQSKIKNNAAYIYSDTKDTLVSKAVSEEQKTYLELRGAKVDFDIKTGVGHMFEAKSPFNLAKYCYGIIEPSHTVKDYTYTFEN